MYVCGMYVNIQFKILRDIINIGSTLLKHFRQWLFILMVSLLISARTLFLLQTKIKSDLKNNLILIYTNINPWEVSLNEKVSFRLY